MSDVEIKVNFGEVGKLLRGSETEKMMRYFAGNIQNNAGEGYNSDARMPGTRWISTVYTATRKAADDNAKNNSLLKALGG